MQVISESRRLLLLSFAAVAMQLAGCATIATTATTASLPEDQVKVIAPGGKLKIAVYQGTPTSFVKDSKTGEPTGVGYELGRDLAKQLGVAFEPIVYSRNAEVLEAVKAGKADMAFTNATPARARDMDFSQPYLEIELGYLISPSARVTDIVAIDQAGIRVAVTEGSSSDGVLSGNLKNARIVRAKTIQTGIEMLSDGRADVYATNKSTLFEMADKLPGAKVLDGRWGAEVHAIGIPKGRGAAMPLLRRLLEDARNKGVVRSAIQNTGLRGAVEP